MYACILISNIHSQVRYDDWNGATPNERYEALDIVEKYSTSVVKKMSDFGIEDIQVWDLRMNAICLMLSSLGM